MVLLILEALFALLILVGIVWWTMFSGRKNGELVTKDKGAPVVGDTQANNHCNNGQPPNL